MFIIGTDLLPLQSYADIEFTNTGLTSGRQGLYNQGNSILHKIT